jgi:hypothetical protein
VLQADLRRAYPIQCLFVEAWEAKITPGSRPPLGRLVLTESCPDGGEPPTASLPVRPFCLPRVIRRSRLETVSDDSVGNWEDEAYQWNGDVLRASR